MLQVVSRLSAGGRVIAAATRPAPAVKHALIPMAQNGVRSYLPSRLQLCQFNTGATTSYGLTSNIASRLTSVLGQRMSPWTAVSQPSLLALTLPTSTTQTRSVTKWSLQKGKRKTVMAVIRRFKRLHWEGRGIWIRARQGANKKIWRKSHARRIRCKTHVFCNATQSTMLDKMVTRYWKKMRYYPDDPYRPYMRRNEFRLTRRYPKEFY